MPLGLIGLKPQPHTWRKAKEDVAFYKKFFADGYSCFLLPITNQSYKEVCKSYFHSSPKSMDTLNAPFPEFHHTDLHPCLDIHNIVGLVSSWLELDNDDLIINEFSSQVLINELSYGHHLGIDKYMLSPPKNINNIQVYASNIAKILKLFPSIQISISLPMCQDYNESNKEFFDLYSTWDTWNVIRTLCNYNENLHVSLGAPMTNIPSAVLDRWLHEPISFYLISVTKFISNAKSYPVLNKFNQLILWKMLQFKSLELPVIILHGVDRIGQENELVEYDSNKKSTYLSYIQHLVSISKKSSFVPYISEFILSELKDSGVSKQFINSPAVLQCPLEPLTENLQDYTYNLFEKDSFKYEQYGRAFIKALIQLNKSWNLEEKPHILFLGPGRGPLIDKFFDALEFLQTPSENFTITAIERNPAVMIYLKQRNSQLWKNNVNILNMDARDYDNSQYAALHSKVNMVISELIGSFGCNELMPECIDSISNSVFCDPHCVFIPQKLDCYVAPVLAPKYWKLALKLSFDKMYIPMIPEMELFSERPEPVWSFVSESKKNNQHLQQTHQGSTNHNDSNSSDNVCTIDNAFSTNNLFRNKHNSRNSRISIQIEKKGTLHGLAGYFKAALFDDIEVSNLPKEVGMRDCVSWLPAFFPLESPLNMFEGQEVSVFMQRICSGPNVWYEWSVQGFLYTLLTNSLAHTPHNSQENSRLTNSSQMLSTSNNPSPKKNSMKHINSPANSYDDANAQYTMSLERNLVSINENKVRLCTGTSRIHNLNGCGFKLKLIQ